MKRGVVNARKLLGPGTGFQAAQRCRLRLAAAFSHRFSKVGKQHCKPQPHRNREGEGGCACFTEQLLCTQQRRQNAANVNHKHHRVTPLDVRAEFDERLANGRLEQRWVKQHRVGFNGSHVLLGLFGRPKHQMLDHRPERQRGYVVQQAHHQHRAD